MAQRKPLVIGSNNEMEEIPSGDTLGLAHGGAGADLSTTGPGVLVQASAGAAVSVRSLADQLAALLATAGTPEPGQVLRRNAADDDYEWADIGAPVLELTTAEAYGDGAAGAITYSSNTTLTSDVDATTVTVNSGVTVSIGWNSSEGRPARIRATTSITINGTVSADGSNGANHSTSVAGAGGASLTGGGGGGGGRGASGGAGGSSGRPSSHGTSTSGTNTFIGGNGGSGDLASGGRGGNVNPPTTTPGEGGGGAPLLARSIATASDLWLPRSGSGGGGSSGGYGSSYGGAGGGGGGGSVFLAAPIITISSTGTVTAKGGDGGAEVSTGAPYYGGGGGGGGFILLLGAIISNAGLLNVAGGARGGTGMANYPERWGEAGHDGSILIGSPYQLTTFGTLPNIVTVVVGIS